MKKTLLFLLLTQSSFAQLQSWIEQSSGVSIPLSCASAIGVYDGWICGYNGTVLRTTNTGINWQNVGGNGIPSTCQLVNIFGIDANVALTAGYIGSSTFVFRTTNGGASWTQVFTQLNGFVEAIWFTNSSNGFMEGDPVGGRWSLWRSSNAGATWDSSGLYLPQASGDLGWSSSMCVLGNSIWFGTSNTRIYFSSNNGISWTAQSSAPEITIHAVSVYLSGAIGYACGPGILRTTNSGNTWQFLGSVGSGFWSGIAIYNIGYALYVRGTGVYRSDYNWGTNFTIVYTAPSGNYRHISQQRNANGTCIWAVRDNGGISKAFIEPEGVITLSNQAPQQFRLYQNYPNPFNPSTRIKFDISSLKGDRGMNVKINLYDLLGREVAVLVNQELKPGTYEVEWDASNYPSGIYFYKLVSGDFSETNKMVLIK